jgi:peptidoglycan hydrolase CwlO-like protein
LCFDLSIPIKKLSDDKEAFMKTKGMMLALLATFGVLLGGCMAQMSQEDQAKLDAALKAADSAAASAQSAEAAAKRAADSANSSASSADQAEAAAKRAESAAKRAETAAASAQSSADKAAKAFEMGLRK